MQKKQQSKKNIFNDIVRLVIGSPAVRYKSLIRLMNVAREAKLIKLSRFISNRLNSKGIYISYRAELDPSVKFPHPIAITIGNGVLVGPNVRIYQNVTLGGARVGDWKSSNYPAIGEGTVIFAGAVIVGNITIGKNCIIGANSVVLKNVPDNSVCVGAPAKIISVNGKKVDKL